MEYYIYISNDCNLGCSYCSVLFDTKKHGIPLTSSYTFEDLEKFINRTQKELNDDVADIYFFGGEPTMRYDIIEKLISTMNKPHDYAVNYIMHSNGLLLSQIPEGVLENLHLALVSINYEKIFKNNQITSYLDKICLAVRSLKKNKDIPVIGRFTISENTSLYTECSMMVNYFDYIYWQMDNCNFFNKPLQYVKQYKSDIERLFEYWTSFLKVGVFLNFVPFITAINRFLYDTEIPTQYYCGYGYSMIYIQTNGKCYACCDSVESETHLIGNIYTGITFPTINLSETKCCNCLYFRICGGRCGRMHKEFEDSHIREYCEMNIHMFSLIEKALPMIKDLILQFPEYEEKIKNPIFAYTEYTA